MERQATARGTGAVGKKAILPQVIQKIVKQDSTISKILDFGCGPSRQHVKLLQTKLEPRIDIQGYDLGENSEILKKKWDLVYASNVINVQMTKKQLFETLQELWTAQKDGRLIVNYPKEPRKLRMNTTEMKQVIESAGWEVQKINTPSKSTTVWELIKNKPKIIPTEKQPWEMTKKEYGKQIGVSESKKFEEAGRTILKKPNSPLTQTLLGKETIKSEKSGFYSYTNPKNETFSFDVIEYISNHKSHRLIAYLVNQQGKRYDEPVAALQFEVYNNEPYIKTIATNEEKIGLASALLDILTKQYGNWKVIPPVSKKGLKILHKAKVRQALLEHKTIPKEVLEEYPKLHHNTKIKDPKNNKMTEETSKPQILKELNNTREKLNRYVELKERHKENPGIKAVRKIKNDPNLYLFFHSGTADQNKNIQADGLQPTFGLWLKEVLVNATDDEDLIQEIQEKTSVIFISKHPDWVKIKIAKKLDKSLQDITNEDIREYGQLSILGINPEEDEVYQADEEAQTATDLTGEDKTYEIPFGVEGGDFFAQDELGIDVALIGEDLLAFLDYWQNQ